MNLTLHPIEIQFFIFSFLSYGVWLRVYLKMTAFVLALTAFVAIKLSFKDTHIFEINKLFILNILIIVQGASYLYIDTCTLHQKL